MRINKDTPLAQYSRVFWMKQDISKIVVLADDESQEAEVLVSVPSGHGPIPLFLVHWGQGEPVIHVLKGDIRIEFSEKAREVVEFTRAHGGGSEWGQEILDRIPKAAPPSIGSKEINANQFAFQKNAQTTDREAVREGNLMLSDQMEKAQQIKKNPEALKVVRQTRPKADGTGQEYRVVMMVKSAPLPDGATELPEGTLEDLTPGAFVPGGRWFDVNDEGAAHDAQAHQPSDDTPAAVAADGE